MKLLRVHLPAAKLRYWRDHAGPEVDYIIAKDKHYTPIEVKWTQSPTKHDAKHIFKFMEEYDCNKQGYIVCRCARPILLDNKIMALPWQDLGLIVSGNTA